MAANYLKHIHKVAWLGMGLCLPPCFFLSAGCRHTAQEARLPTTTGSVQKPLPAADAVEFLQKCLKRYDRKGIKGCRMIMEKQDRIDGKLQPREVVEVFFRTRPYSVFMRWLTGARLAKSVLYVEGENGGKMLAHPAGLAGEFLSVVRVDPEGPQARKESRYTIKHLGLRNVLLRTLTIWRAAEEKGQLQVKYLGVRKVQELGNRACYTLRHISEKPSKSGIMDATIYIDEKTWLEAGTVLLGPGKKLIGEYMFRDIQLNPEFKPNQFEPSALTSE